MPCMCGDTHCWSCGPAQGNTRCPICRVWADDGCDHIDEEGHIKPEFLADAQKLEREERDADEAYARSYLEEQQYVKDHPEWFDARGKYRG